jgi:hypothetical protein
MFVGEPSWAVIEEDDSDLIPLLIVRQLLGVHRFDERNLPAIDDALTAEEGLPRRQLAALAAEWERWWIADTAGAQEDGGPARQHGPEVPSSPRLRDFLDRRWISVEAFAEGFRRRAPSDPTSGMEADLTITHLVNTMEVGRGKPSRPFRLKLEILPFPQIGIWRVTRTRYLVSSDLRGNRQAFGEAIQPILEGLAWAPD